MLIVGLTGNVASGKSTVAERWKDSGAPVVSADQLARDVVAPGTRGLAEVVSVFGDGVLRDDGTLDRAALRAIVFADADARGRLEGILHPLIALARDAWVAEQADRGEPLVVWEIPLLFEAGIDREVDVIVVVDAPEEARLNRMVRDRGLDAAQARAIIKAQWPAETKKTRADYVIENQGTVGELEAAADGVLAALRTRAGEGDG